MVSEKNNKDNEFIKGKIILNEDEAQVLINIIDVAVKSRGLDLAHSAIHLADKINNAFIEPK